MTNINTLYSSLYSQLPNQQSATSSTAPAAPADPLLAALQSADDTSAANTDIVDLSPQAQSYLSQGSSSDNTSPDGESYTLDRSQNKKLAAILDKYKDAPFTEDTFDKMKADMKEAGIAPEQLAAKDSVRSFNLTQLLISAINGDSGGQITLSTPNDASQQAKSDNYTKAVINRWADISTTISSAPEDDAATPVS